MIKLKVKRLHPEAIIPTRAKAGDAGLDLYALHDVQIRPTMTGLEGQIMVIGDGYLPYLPCEVGSAKIPTGIAVEIPFGYWGEIKSRSGIGFNHGIEVGAGTIDAGYRNGIQVKLYNFTDKPYQIKKGDRIAQMVIQKCELLEPEEVDELSESERGEGGFGHSGR